MSSVGKPFPRPKRRPFIEFRSKEIGLGFSLSADHDGARWQPNVWLQIGPFIAGIQLTYGGLA